MGCLRGGGTLKPAAEAAGVSVRALREWIARGEGLSERSKTPKLERFAKRCRQAMAESRLVAEHRVFDQNPKHWLSRTARASAEDEGWSDAPSCPGTSPVRPALQGMTEEELNAALHRMFEVAASYIEEGQ